MRRLVLSLACTLALAASGCTNEIDTSTRPENVLGSYQLATWGGRTLPTTISTDSTGTLQVLSGELVLTAAHEWTETVQVKSTSPAGVSTTGPIVSTGSFSFVRDYAYMLFNDKSQGYQFTGMAAGGGVTLELTNGQQVVYRR